MRWDELDNLTPHNGRDRVHARACVGHSGRGRSAAMYPARIDWRYGRLGSRGIVGVCDVPPRATRKPSKFFFSGIPFWVGEEKFGKPFGQRRRRAA